MVYLTIILHSKQAISVIAEQESQNACFNIILSITILT